MKVLARRVGISLATLSALLVLGAFILSMLGYVSPAFDDPSPDYMQRVMFWALIFGFAAAFSILFSSMES